MNYKKMWYKLLAEVQRSAFYGTDAVIPGATSVLNDMINIECAEFSESTSGGKEGKNGIDELLPDMLC